MLIRTVEFSFSPKYNIISHGFILKKVCRIVTHKILILIFIILFNFNQKSMYSIICSCIRAQSCPAICKPWTIDCQAPLSMALSQQEY